MNNLQIEILAEKTWNSMYPDRRPWREIGKDAREEWIALFEVYEKQRSIYKVENNIA